MSAEIAALLQEELIAKERERWKQKMNLQKFQKKSKRISKRNGINGIDPPDEDPDFLEMDLNENELEVSDDEDSGQGTNSRL